MRLLLCSIAIAASVPAAAAPRMRPFLAAPGIALGGAAIAATFCESSQRAIVRIANGDVLAIDAAGTVTKVASIGRMSSIARSMACDARGRIVIAAGRTLVIVDGQTIKQETLAKDLRYVRVLDDDSIGIIDARGDVHRWDGKKVTRRWSAKTTLQFHRDPFDLHGSGDRYVAVLAGRAVVFERDARIEGPRAVGASWLDASTLLIAERGGAISRWKIGTDEKQLELIHQIDDAPRFGFSRINIHRAGRRYLIEVFTGVFRALALDGGGKLVGEPVAISRLPPGFHLVAGGATSPFAIATLDDRVMVLELGRSYALVDPRRPIGIVSGLAFSPDGRSLALLSSAEQDVLVASLDGRRFMRLPSKQRVRPPIRWAPNGSLHINGPRQLVRWHLDGSLTASRMHLLGFFPNGDPIANDRDAAFLIERAHGVQRLTFSQDARSAHEVDATDDAIAVRSLRHVEVFRPDGTPVLTTRARAFIRAMVLVGDQPAVMFVDDVGELFLATAAGEQSLQRLDPVAMLAASHDRKRVAVGSNTTIRIYDDRGTLVAELDAGARVSALAWSPDLHTLAVATRAGVVLWTIPR